MRRGFVLVLLVLLVVLAGCSGVFGGSDGTSTETVTPMAVPTDEPTETPVPQFAPGLTGRGIENADALDAAHAAALEHRSFTTTGTTVETLENGTVVSRTTSRLRAGPPGTSAWFVTERIGSNEFPDGSEHPIRTEGWAEDGMLFGNLTYANGTTTYDRTRIRGESRLGVFGVGGLQYLLDALGTRNTSVTKRRRGGTTLYLVRGDTQNGVFGSVRLRMLVDDRGLVRRYHIVRVSSYNGTPSRITIQGAFSMVGTTAVPDRPAWVETAIDRTALSASTERGMATTTLGTANRTETATLTTTEVSPQLVFAR